MEKWTLYAILQLVLPLSAVQTNWDYQLLDVICESSTPEILQIDCTTERLGPNDFGFTGSINVKQNLTDAQLSEILLFRSARGNSKYIQTPFRTGKIPLTQFMNFHYKNVFMDSLKICADGAPVFEKFKPPLAKCRMQFTKCKLSTDLRQYLQSGFYKLRIQFSGMAKAFLEYHAKVIVSR